MSPPPPYCTLPIVMQQTTSFSLQIVTQEYGSVIHSFTSYYKRAGLIEHVAAYILWISEVTLFVT